MARWVIFVLLAVVSLAIAGSDDARVDNNPKSNHILLRRKTIDVEKEYAPFVGRKKQESSQSSWIWSKPAEAEQIMVHYDRRISADDHFALESLAGAGSVLAYIPTNTYLVQIPRASMKTTIQEFAGVKWIGPMLPEYKISEHLQNGTLGSSFDEYSVAVHILTPECTLAEDYELRHQCIERVVQTWRDDDEDLAKLISAYDVNVTVLAGGISEVLVRWSPAAVLGLETGVRSRIVQWAAEKLEVHWVEVRLAPPKAKLQVHDKWATKLMRSRTSYPSGGPTGPQMARLQGEGQIIGVSDTGIDHDHCFFHDPSNAVPFNTVNRNHRKIVMYDTVLGDQKDFVDGHGTHISGTAAGDCYMNASTINEWGGMARQAKIAFIDMAKDDVNANNRDLNYPTDLGKEIYSKVYNAGGRIMSESWGGEPQGYPTSHTQMMDQFQYDKPDFLIIRSAGNEGDHYVSLNTQAASKNCIVVGASQNSNDSFIDVYSTFYDYTTAFQRRRREVSAYNSSYASVTQDICCRNDTQWSFYPYCCPQSKIDYVRSSPYRFSAENMVQSSSKGPTWDARIKPDLVAPGEYIVNARSDGNTTSFQSSSGSLQQNLLPLSGTSMSTPLVAGAAAIIREYLVKGYYNSSDGNPHPSRAVPNPPAALIKAMLINSARPLRGLDYQAGKWVSLPTLRNSYYTGANFVEGFGVVSLDQILPFGNASGFQLSLPNLGNRAIAGNESHQYCFTVQQPGEVWITLTWTEHPGSPITVIQLINDLDLIVMRNSGPDTYIFYGNMPFDRFGTAYTTDTLNNVERVSFSVRAGDNIRFNISGANVPFRVQPYAVAMRSPPAVQFECKECFGTERRSCHIPNGVGQKRCVNGKWGPCLVVACASDYTVDAWKNRCKRFMQYYQVNLIASGVMGLIAAFFCLPFWCYDRHKMKRDAKYPGVPLTQAELQREAGPWEMYTVVKPNLALTIMGSLIGLGAQTSTLIQPLFVGKLIQQLNDNAPWGSVRNTLFLIILSAVCELVLGTVSGWIMQVAEEANLLLLRHRLYETIMMQRYNFFERRDLSELQNRLIVDCASSVGFPSQFLNSLFGSLSRLIVALIMIFSISPHLSFVFLAMVPIFGLIAYVFGRLIQPITVKQLDLSSKSATIAWDCLKNIRVVKAYGQIAQEIQRYKTATTESYDLNIKISVITTLARLSNTSLTEAAAIVFLWYGSILVLQPRISTGLLLSFTLYVGYAVAGCSSIFNLWPSYKKTIGAMDKVFAILRLKPDQREETPMKALSAMVADPKGVRGEISVQNLSFHYEGQEHKMVIKRLNLEMRPGRLHIVTGPSGAGKSTLINLITRLYDPTSGSIVVDGTVDLSTLRPIDLIALVSIIEQEPKIFNRSVQENLTYGSPEVSDWRIEEISKLCNVHDFVIQLPEAYQTVIGEDSTGVRLSGGQKQRICMARALMKDCRILLLDEPTNDLDIENEKLLLDIIYQLAKNKLVILITHHLNLVRENESVVYFMENGVIREQGSHSQLMALRGRYFRFVQLAQLMQNPEAGDVAQSFQTSRAPPPSGGGGGGGGLLPRGGGGGQLSESERSEREDDPRRGLLPRAGTRGGK